MKIISVVGARPNFMKIAPFIKAIDAHNRLNPLNSIKHLLIHTGQHYDVRMSESFFKELAIPDPDINLEVGSGSHAEQLGYTMIEFEKAIIQEKPDWIVVVGDVNATLSCTVVAKRHQVKVCHIEAGLRSGDMSMPEEINRLVTDRLSDLLLTPDELSSENLRKEGVPENKIKFVGNIMIDTLRANRGKAEKLSILNIVKDNAIEKQIFAPDNLPFALMSLHRPSNVDERKVLISIIAFILKEVANDMYIIWPIHPRTQNRLTEFGLWDELFNHKKILLLHPVGYLEMLKFNMEAQVILTDSGGLQEESCVLGTPCLTLRWNTERPITLREYGGVSVLVGNNVDHLRKEYQAALKLDRKPKSPLLWDGKTAERCVNAILNYNEK